MKPLLYAAITLLFTSSTTLLADGLETEIRSGSYCKNDVFDRFKLVEKTNHKRLKFKPTTKLLDFAVSREMMCPWSIEIDLNADNKKDWVGFVKLDKEYQLLAYLSGPKQYATEILERSEKAPSNRYLRWFQTKSLKHYTDKNINIGSTKYALQVTEFKDVSNIYLWDGKTLQKALTSRKIQ